MHQRSRDQQPFSPCAQRGFTLIEMIMVITLSGILAITVSGFITKPIEGFKILSRRAELVDIAETALRRMSREVRLALPNSVRVTGTSVEFLRTLNGGRYRAQVATSVPPDPPPPPGNTLDFSAAAGTFDVLGPLPNFGAIDVGASSAADCINGVSDCLVVYNTGQTGADAYNGDNLAGIVTASANSISFIRGTPFPFSSPRQRFHIVDTPVSYVCSGGQVNRHSEYAIGAAPGGTVNLLVDQVTACAFQYSQGTSSRAGLLTITLSISEAGESVRLFQQIHVPNQP